MLSNLSCKIIFHQRKHLSSHSFSGMNRFQQPRNNCFLLILTRLKHISYLRRALSLVQIFFKGGAPDSSSPRCRIKPLGYFSQKKTLQFYIFTDINFIPRTCVSDVLCLTLPDDRRTSLIRVGGSSAPSLPKLIGSAFIRKEMHMINKTALEKKMQHNNM